MAGAFVVALALAAATPAAGQFPAPAVSSADLLHLAGYGSVVLSRSRDGERRDIELGEAALALLASGTLGSSLGYFAELELAGRTRENWAGHGEEHNLEIERLYLEYSIDDRLRIRAGRFLTPVGQWNEVHAAPLTWTALRPLTSYRAFAKSTTGVMLAGSLELGGRDAGYAVYLAPRWPLTRRAGEEVEFSRAVGGRIAAEPVPDLFVGASAVRYRTSRPGVLPRNGGPGGSPAGDREEDPSDRQLLGADLTWYAGLVEVRAEATYVTASPESARERGVFVQAAIPVVARLSAVLRTESYDPVAGERVRVHTIGAVYRPDRRIAFKAERQIASHPSPVALDGWFVSASALF